MFSGGDGFSLLKQAKVIDSGGLKERFIADVIIDRLETLENGSNLINTQLEGRIQRI